MMSAPFAVVHGLVTGRIVDMPAVVALGKDGALRQILQKSRLIGDDEVPPLSAVIEVLTGDRERLVHEQRMSAADYRFDRAAVRTMVRDTITGLPDHAEAQKRFDRFDQAVSNEVTPGVVAALFTPQISRALLAQQIIN